MQERLTRTGSFTHDRRRVAADLVADVLESLAKLLQEAVKLLGELAELIRRGGSGSRGGGRGRAARSRGDASLLLQRRNAGVELREERGERGDGGRHLDGAAGEFNGGGPAESLADFAMGGGGSLPAAGTISQSGLPVLARPTRVSGTRLSRRHPLGVRAARAGASPPARAAFSDPDASRESDRPGLAAAMDEFSRSAKYEYRANSNLVLEADRKPGGRKSEPSGEATAVSGKDIKMGDRVAAGRPAEVAARKEADAKKRRRVEPAEVAGLGEYGSKHRRRAGRTGDLGAVEEAGYRPRTRETAALWELVLREAQAALGDQPQEILSGAAEEVLAALKDDALREPQKKARVEAMLGPLADDAFGRLLQVSKGINDFTASGAGGAAGGASGGGGLDEDIGVAVQFDDEDDDEGNEVAEVQDDEETDVDDGAWCRGVVRVLAAVDVRPLARRRRRGSCGRLGARRGTRRRGRCCRRRGRRGADLPRCEFCARAPRTLPSPTLLRS